MKTKPALPPPALSEAELNALYDELNRTHFGGALPKAVVYLIEPGGARHASYEPMSGTIFISPISAARFGRVILRRILLHEMCHVAVTDFEAGHGPRWRAEMAKLLDLGESWVPEDVAAMAAVDAERERTAQICQAMTEEKFDPALPWGEIRARLVRRFGRRAVDGSTKPRDRWRAIQEGPGAGNPARWE